MQRKRIFSLLHLRLLLPLACGFLMYCTASHPGSPPPPAPAAPERGGYTSKDVIPGTFLGRWNTADGKRDDLLLQEFDHEGVTYGVIEGDIVLGPKAMLATPRAGEKSIYAYGDAKPWALALVPYEFAPDFASREMALAAMEEFTRAKTPVRFVPRQPNAPGPYLRFYSTTNEDLGGKADYGYNPSRRQHRVWLNSDPTKGRKEILIHELMHSLGFAHEHCRADRDQWVTVNLQNVSLFNRSQFKNPPLSRDIGDYDYLSIMHYYSAAFSNNQKPTILPVPHPPKGKPFPAAKLGYATTFSKGDLAALKLVYGPEAEKRKATHGR